MFKSPFEAIDSIRTSDLKQTTEKIKVIKEPEVSKEDLDKAYIEEVLSDDEKLQELYEDIKYNGKEIDELTARIFYEKKQRNKKEYVLLQSKVSEIKNKIENTLIENEFSFNIEKNKQLQKYMNDVFGGNKKVITSKDYIYLMKLKEDLDLKIQDELSEIEES